MRISKLQKVYSLDKLIKPKCKTVENELGHLMEEVGELAKALNENSNIGEELADVVIVTAVLANRLRIDLERQVQIKTITNISTRKLKRTEGVRYTINQT